MSSKKGKLFILMGPTAVGKNTLVDELCRKGNDLVKMPTATERKKRPEEIHGVTKFFLSKEEFDAAVKNDEFIEWQWVHGYRYGTLKKVIEQRIDIGKYYTTDIEVLGTMVLKKRYGSSVKLVYVLPPSLNDLEKRIMGRDSESDKEKKTRLSRIKPELAYLPKADRVLLNDDLNESKKRVVEIFNEEKNNDGKGLIEKDGVKILAKALIFDEKGSRVIVQENSLPQVEVEFGEYLHTQLKNHLEEKFGIEFQFLKNKAFEIDKNKDLKITQPVWVTTEQKEEGIAICYYYAARIADGNPGDFVWAGLETIDFPKEKKEIEEALKDFV